MTGEPNPTARVLAPAALILGVIVLVIVIGASLGGSGEEKGGGGAGPERATTAPEETATQPTEKHYVVEPGDTLSSISRKTGVPVERLSQLNPDLDPQALISGQRVRLH